MNIRKLYLSILLILGIFFTLSAQEATIDKSYLDETDLYNEAFFLVSLQDTFRFVRHDDTLSREAITLVNAPAGLRVVKFEVTDDLNDSTHAYVTFICGDFDLTYSNFYLTIHDSVLANTVEPGHTIQTETCELRANLEIASLTSSPATLTEQNIGTDGSTYILVDLTDEQFYKDPDEFDHDSLSFPGFPDNIVIDRIVNGSPASDKARVYINYNPVADFDDDITDARISIEPSILVYSTVDTLLSRAITIQGVDESIEVGGQNNLVENTLDEGYIRIDLVNDSTTVTGDVSGDVELILFPNGTSIETAVSDGDNVFINLDFDFTNFDTTFDHSRIRIDRSILKWNTGDDLYTDEGDITIQAYAENPSAAVNPDVALTEYNLDGRVLTVTLSDDWIDETGTFGTEDVGLVTTLSNLGISDVIPLDSLSFEVYLSHSYEDFDASTGIQLSINYNELHYSTANLISETEPISATNENPQADLSGGPLYEYDLDGQSLDVHLVEEWIINTGSFSDSDVHLLNATEGLGISSVSISDSANFTINLENTWHDFDDNRSMTISIMGSNLMQTSDSLVSDAITLDGYPETPVATATPSSWLREFALDTISIRVDFFEEAFLPAVTLLPGDYGLNNAPPGLDIASVLKDGDSTLIVNLDFTYPDSDFDIEYYNMRIWIDNTVLIQTESGILESSLLPVDPNIEPVVNNVSILNQSMMIGDAVEVDIFLSEYSDSTYTPGGGDIGGYPLYSLNKESDSHYTAWFTVTEGGNDYLADKSIPVNGLQLNALPVNGIEYNDSIIQDSDLLDAHKPVVSSLFLLDEVDKKIGDKVVLLISAFEAGLVPEDSTEINTIPISDTSVVFKDIGGGTYSLTYTIAANDPNVPDGGLQAKIYLSDEAGNINDSYPPIAANDLSIDAVVPVIDSINNATLSDTVIIGGEVILTVSADGPDYLLSDESWINGVYATEGLGFVPSGSTYTITYPVKDGDATVAAGSLEAYIILEDASGNKSTAETVILNNDDLAVLTVRPTALLTGHDEICINDTASLYITLTGIEPWKLKYRDEANSYYIEDITTSSYTLLIDPDSTMNYSIDSVWDGTGNENSGSGNSLVVVHPLPVVLFDTAFAAFYAVTDSVPINLVGIPAGGEFFGQGVNTLQSIFRPDEAGLTGSTGADTVHWLFYEYTDANTCFNVDSQAVRIVEADVSFAWTNSTSDTACYLYDEVTLFVDNLDGTIGQFSIKDDIYPPGFMTDNGDNTATFNPSILDWVTTGQDYTVGLFIRYDYLNKDGVPLYEHTEMVIEYFETAKIGTNLSEQKYCTNEGTFSLEGSRPTNDVFSGSGVVDLGGFEYEFDLSKADTGENWITYTYISPYKCVQKDSAMIVVYEAPDPEFEFIEHCVLAEGGLISMSNISDTSGLVGSLSWEWVYGDIPSGEFNRDVFFTMQNGSHYYPGPGRRTVSLTGTDTISDKKRCQEVESITIDLGNTPDVDISWDTECFTDSPVQFKGTSETEDGDENFLWRITDMAGTEVVSDEGPALDMLSHQFAARDKYSVEFTAVTDKGCIAAITDTIYLRPYIRNITDDAPYTEDFEGDAAGWYSFMLKDSPKKSWKLDDVETEKFPYDLPENGSRAWYTDLVNKDTVEQSWVSSPCFDFSSARRPMISLDRKVSSDRDRDGTALQYTYDDGETWHNVGAVDDGSVNWYNTFRIQYGPGGQGEGWTGAFEFDSLENWKQSRHNLDQLTGKSRVQFRIAYASSGPSVYQYKGFAFDNIWIGERSRVVLIEHFTNSGMIESNEANQRINKLVKNNFLDVIDIQYHVEAEGYTDKMNEDNPAPASARSLFYGTRKVPYALIDGGLGGLMAYDFSENDLDTLDLFTRALADPSFNIEFEASSQDGKVDINIDLEALDTLPYGEYIVYTVIVEKTIDDPAYTGAGSVSVFENVVRAMVPNAAGISLIRDWNPGDSEQIPLSWDISDNILNEDLAYVVVFVQGAENQKVYQAASNDPDLNSDPVISSVNDHLESGSLSMMVYPNPATGTAYLSFSESLAETVEVQLFTHTGSLARNGLLLAGTEVYEMDVSGLARGVYFIRAIQDGKVIGTRKLMIMR